MSTRTSTASSTKSTTVRITRGGKTSEAQPIETFTAKAPRAPRPSELAKKAAKAVEPAPVAHVTAPVAEAFGLTGAPNVVVTPEPARSLIDELLSEQAAKKAAEPAPAPEGEKPARKLSEKAQRRADINAANKASKAEKKAAAKADRETKKGEPKAPRAAKEGTGDRRGYLPGYEQFIPAAGTILNYTFKGVTHEFLMLEGGRVMFNGAEYRGLTSACKAMTGAKAVNVYKMFGLRPQDATAPAGKPRSPKAAKPVREVEPVEAF